MQGLLATFLERSIDTFLRQQEALQTQISRMVANTPLATMADMTRQNLEAISRIQENMLNALLSKREKTDDNGSPGSGTSQPSPPKKAPKKRA